MLRAFFIAWKDVRHTYRNLPALAMMFVGPLLLATAIGGAFGSGDNFVVASVRTAIVNQDVPSGPSTVFSGATPVAGVMLHAALASPELSDLVVLTDFDTPEEARAAVDGGEADVAVIIPAGLSAALAGPTVDHPVEVELYKKPGGALGPTVVATIVESVLAQMEGARSAAAASVKLASAEGLTEPSALAVLARRAAEAFVQARESGDSVSLQSRSPMIPGVESAKRPNVASQVLVGMMLFFMLFGASIPARSILEEHRMGTLPRLFTTPARRPVILAGKYLAVFLVVLIQSVVLVLAGWLLLGAHWGPSGPVVVLVVCGALVAASLALLTVSFAKTSGQAGAVSSAIFVAMALISGNFFGTASVGETFAKVRRISPLGWLMEAWGRLLFGGSWAEIALPVLAVLAFALGFFALATFFFRRRYA